MCIKNNSKKLFIWLSVCFSLVILSSCSDVKTEQNDFVSGIEKAHNKTTYSKNKATQFNIIIEFGGNERLNGVLTLRNDSQKGKIELKSGEEILFIKDKVYASNSLTDNSKIRFDAYTWSYFFQFPYKLSDGGTVWTDYKSETEGFNTKKLSFKSGTGDAPDDWYVIYTDPKTNLIQHAAYIVTAHGGKEKAEKNPHAIVYSDYKEINNIPVAHKWTFKNWNSKTGLGSTIGSASISNLKSLNDLKDDFFTVSKNLKEINL